MGALFAGRPSDDTPPKTIPDQDTLRAAWFTIEEMADLPLRGPEVIDLFRHVLDGGQVFPMEILRPEGE